MKNSFFDQVNSNLQNVKLSLQNVLKENHATLSPQKQLSFDDILFQTKECKDLQLKQQIQLNLESKIKQAIRNSSVAKIVYHDKNPQKLAQKCFEQSQAVKELQNEISLSNVSKILDLKKSNISQAEEVEMSGILLKYSPSFFGGWSERFCCLSKTKFVYNQNQVKNSSVAGFINFSILCFTVKPRFVGDKIDQFEIKVAEGQKKFIFKGVNHLQTLRWYEKLRLFIQDSEGKANNFTNLSNYPRFWRKQYITQKLFEKSAQSGDIILFRGKKTSAVLQRAVTGEEFDHIGVILLNTFRQILVFEANGGFGVGICPWRKFIKNKWFQDQQIVAIRHLKINRSEEFLQQITKFVENNIGKQYNFSLKNYFMKRHSTVDSQKGSYFCSSLVAKLYKKLGLLDPTISSNRYMPYDFSDKQKLHILSGRFGKAELQKEKIIVFDNKENNKIFQKKT